MLNICHKLSGGWFLCILLVLVLQIVSRIYNCIYGNYVAAQRCWRLNYCDHISVSCIELQIVLGPTWSCGPLYAPCNPDGPSPTLLFWSVCLLQFSISVSLECSTAPPFPFPSPYLVPFHWPHHFSIPLPFFSSVKIVLSSFPSHLPARPSTTLYLHNRYNFMINYYCFEATPQIICFWVLRHLESGTIWLYVGHLQDISCMTSLMLLWIVLWKKAGR